MTPADAWKKAVDDTEKNQASRHATDNPKSDVTNAVADVFKEIKIRYTSNLDK